MKVSLLERYAMLPEWISEKFFAFIYWLRSLSSFSGWSLPSFGGFKMPYTWILMIALAVVPAGVVWFKGKVRHAAEIEKVRAHEQQACTAKLHDLEAKINRDADGKIKRAREAAAKINDPKTDQELIEICKRSASCRSRGELK